MALETSVVVKDRIVIASFKGVMDRGATAPLEECTKQILEASPRAVLLNMKGVENIKSEAYRPFAMLTKALKTARVPFRYVAFEARLKQYLIQDGLLTHVEAKDSLEAGLKDLMETAPA